MGASTSPHATGAVRVEDVGIEPALVDGTLDFSGTIGLGQCRLIAVSVGPSVRAFLA